MFDSSRDAGVGGGLFFLLPRSMVECSFDYLVHAAGAPLLGLGWAVYRAIKSAMGFWVGGGGRRRQARRNNTRLLGDKPAQEFTDDALGKHATDIAAKVKAGTLHIDEVVGVSLHYEASGKWRADMGYNKNTYQLGNQTRKWYARMRYKKNDYRLGSYTTDLSEAIRRRLLAEKAIALFPDKNPEDYVAARTGPAGKKQRVHRRRQS